MPYGFFYDPNSSTSLAAGCAGNWNLLSPDEKVAAMEEHLRHVAEAEGREYTGTPAAALTAAIEAVNQICANARITYYPVGYYPIGYRSWGWRGGFHGGFHGGHGHGPHPSHGVLPAGQAAAAPTPLATAAGQATANVTGATIAATAKQVAIVGGSVIALGIGAYLLLRKPAA